MGLQPSFAYGAACSAMPGGALRAIRASALITSPGGGHARSATLRLALDREASEGQLASRTPGRVGRRAPDLPRRQWYDAAVRGGLGTPSGTHRQRTPPENRIRGPAGAAIMAAGKLQWRLVGAFVMDMVCCMA